MKAKNIAVAIKNIIVSIGRADLLIRMKAHKLFPFILYTFFLAWLSIWLSWQAETTMLEVEKNKKTLETLRIQHAQKTGEIVSLDRISTLEKLLEKSGSDVKIPVKPADRIKK